METEVFKLRILRVTNSIGSKSSPYNSFSLPMQDVSETGICTFLCEDKFRVSEKIRFYNAEKSIRSFIHLLRRAHGDIQPQIVHAHHPQTALILLLYSIFRRTPLVYTIHNMFCNYRFLHRVIMLLIALFYDRVIFCSESAFRSIPRLYKYLLGKRFHIIQNGVDLDRIDRVLATFCEKRGKSVFKVINIGRLTAQKNQKTLINIFTKMASGQCKLSIIGAGELEKELREIANGNPNIEFSGTYPRDDVFILLRKADLFVSTSWWEGLPIAPLEAMACGCPVILSDIEPHREIVGNADFIPLVSPDDINGFISEINRIIDMSEDERKSIGQKCRKHVENNFSLTRMCNGYQDIYRLLAKQRSQH